MTQRSPFTVIIALFAVLMTLGITGTILLGGRNEVAQLCKYLLGVAFVVGFLSPRASIVLLLVISGYTDLVKRLMVVSGRVSQIDLYYVLGIPPVMLGAIALSVVMGVLMGTQKIRNSHWTLLFISGGLIVLSVAAAVQSAGMSVGAILPAVANHGFYALLIFLIPVLFSSEEQAVKLLKTMIWAYLPVGIYGIFQKMNGYLPFEIEYLKTGMSMEIKQLIGNEVRPFSTLNSPTAYASITCTLAALSLIMAFRSRPDGSSSSALHKVTGVLLAVTYLAGWVASTGRAGIIVFVFAMVGWICFRAARSTRFLYIMTGVAFVGLMISASHILTRMEAMQARISESVGDNHFANQLTRIGSYSDRLMGFSNMVSNPKAWTLFGHGQGAGERDKSLYSHDLISNILITYGAVVLLGAAAAFYFVMSRLHRAVFNVKDIRLRSFAAALLSLALSFLVVSVLSGSVMQVFPINVFLFTYCALMVLTFQLDRDLAENPEAAAVMDATPAASPRRMIYRFSRSGSSVP